MHPSWIHVLRHLVISKELQNVKLTTLSRIWLRNRGSLDPIPTPLVVKCIDFLLPVISNISLDSGHFPLAWKEVLVLPSLKKAGLDTVFKNYRPVSDLSFISKVTEKAVFLQIDNYMKKHDLYPPLQFANKEP